MRDADGYLTYVGRADDVFKASDYRISPFELESALIEHPAVAEAAIVPSPDPLRLAVPKAFISLAASHSPTRDTALAIFRHIRAHLAPYKRVRRLEFADLPKTISGKIRRVELRTAEAARATQCPPRRSRILGRGFSRAGMTERSRPALSIIGLRQVIDAVLPSSVCFSSARCLSLEHGFCSTTNRACHHAIYRSNYHSSKHRDDPRSQVYNARCPGLRN